MLFIAFARCRGIPVSISRCLGTGDPGTPTPDLCSAAWRKATTALDLGRSLLVGDSFPGLGRLAFGKASASAITWRSNRREYTTGGGFLCTSRGVPSV